MQAMGCVLLVGCTIAALATATSSDLSRQQLAILGSAAALAIALIVIATFSLRQANAFNMIQVG
jgi:flagellar biosynthesis/type III secretory pathway M-ring protein FliF/YscJ